MSHGNQGGHLIIGTGCVNLGSLQGDERSYAMRLAHNVTPTELSQWTQGDAISWANDSHDVATSVIYGELPHRAFCPKPTRPKPYRS
jgi:hypothetical protein